MGKHLDVCMASQIIAVRANLGYSTLFIPLTNGGPGGAIVMFLVTTIGMGLVVVSMAEMASMQVVT